MTVPCENCVALVSKHNLEYAVHNPLMRAIQNGHESCAIYFIQEGIDVRSTFYRHMHTPLISAVSKDLSTQVIRCLLDAGSIVNQPDAEGRTALFYAVMNGNGYAVNELIASGANKLSAHGPYSNTFLLKRCISCGFSNALKLLLQNRKVNVDKHFDDNDYGKTPLILATFLDRVDCMRDLIHANAQVNKLSKDGRTALSYTTTAEQAQLLVESGANIYAGGQAGNVPLMWAAVDNNTQLLQILIDIGVDVNYENEQGNTGLSVAATFGTYDCLRLLVLHGAYIDKVYVTLGTALFMSAARGHLKCVRFLLQQGACVNMGENRHHCCTLTAWRSYANKDATKHMFVAGQNLDIPGLRLPAFIKDENTEVYSLQHYCRRSVRKHLIRINPNKNLFQRIPNLGLPSRLVEYLLYDISLEDV